MSAPVISDKLKDKVFLIRGGIKKLSLKHVIILVTRRGGRVADVFDDSVTHVVLGRAASQIAFTQAVQGKRIILDEKEFFELLYN